MPWSDLVALVQPCLPEAGRCGQQPFAAETIIRIHFLQHWFNLPDPAMEEALHYVPLFRDFAGLSSWDDAVPSETSILRFRHRLEEAQAPRPDPVRCKRPVHCQEATVEGRHRGGRYAHLGTEFDEVPGWHA